MDVKGMGSFFLWPWCLGQGVRFEWLHWSLDKVFRKNFLMAGSKLRQKFSKEAIEFLSLKVFPGQLDDELVSECHIQRSFRAKIFIYDLLKSLLVVFSSVFTNLFRYLACLDICYIVLLLQWVRDSNYLLLFHFIVKLWCLWALPFFSEDRISSPT